MAMQSQAQNRRHVYSFSVEVFLWLQQRFFLFEQTLLLRARHALVYSRAPGEVNGEACLKTSVTTRQRYLIQWVSHLSVGNPLVGRFWKDTDGLKSMKWSAEGEREDADWPRKWFVCEQLCCGLPAVQGVLLAQPASLPDRRSSASGAFW